MMSPLSADRLAQFRAQGFLVLPQMVDGATVAAIRAQSADDLAAERAPVEFETEVGYAGAPASLDAEGGRTVRRLRAAYERGGALQAWASDARLIAMLRQLLGEGVVLTLAHHNCVMTKHPRFGTATGWHRDIRYWRFARNELISVWLALGRETAGNGALRVLPGSQHWQMQPGELDDLDFLLPDVESNRARMQGDTVVDLEAGDVLLFHSGLFHAAGRNETGEVKMSAVFAYRGQSNPPQAGSRSAAAGEVDFG